MPRRPNRPDALSAAITQVFCEPLESRTLLAAALNLAGAQTLIGSTNVRVSIDSTTRQSEMSVAINPTNPLNMVAFTHRIGATSMATYYTFDGGNTWTPRLIDSSIDGVSATTRFDPTVAFDSQGRLFIAYGADPSGGTRRLIVARSLDGGVTYPTTSIVATNSSLDKWIMNTGRDPNNPSQQNVYVAYRIGTGSLITVHLAASYNNGVTWPVDTIVPDAGQAGADFSSFGMPAVGPNGELYVIWDDYAPSPLGSLIKMAYSADAGATFQPDRTITNTIVTRGNANGFTPTSGTRYHIAAQPDRGILTVPSIAVDRSNGPFRGRVYMAYTDGGTGGGTNNTDVAVRYSDNNGLTWSVQSIVHDFLGNQASQFLPWLDVDGHSGAVAVVYYDTRSSPTNQLATLYTSVSVDGGASWAEAPLATVASNQSLSNGSRYGGNYLEYIGVAVRDGTVQAIWADTRDNLGDLEMYTARASINSAIDSNVLAITGDPAIDNNVVVRLSPTNTQFLEVLVNGVREYTGLAATIDIITITTGSGKDTIQITNIPNSISVSVRTGDDNDTIDINNTGATLTPVALDSGPGNDTLLLNSAGVGKCYVVPVGSDHFDVIDIGVDSTLALLASGNILIVTKSLAISASGRFDLFDNDLIIDYSTPSPASTVQGWINSARAGGTWMGFGLTSMGAHNANPRNTTLGLLEGSEYIGLYGAGAVFSGETVDNTMVLVKYTYYGDTDFNGFVNFDDYSRTDAGFNQGRSGWLNGDFDGNGVVNFDDYALIDLAFNTQTVVLRPGQPPRSVAKKPSRLG